MRNDGAHRMCFVTKLTSLKYRNMRKRVGSSTEIKVSCHHQHQILVALLCTSKFLLFIFHSPQSLYYATEAGPK